MRHSFDHWFRGEFEITGVTESTESTDIMTTDTVAVALVTRNAAAWIDGLLDSIQSQSRAPDRIVVVDDRSTDDTVDRIRRSCGSLVAILPSVSTGSRSIDRIADNFTQAVRACSSCDLVILGDHDDTWHPDRIAHQSRILSAATGKRPLMVASDGRLTDEVGRPTGATLRSHFWLPGARNLTDVEALRMTLTHLVATGGASAIRPAGFPSLEVPRGWLHDRWWSLVAAAQGGLIVDDALVIDYRVHPGQQAGLDRASHGSRSREKLLRVGPLTGARKLLDLRRVLRPQASNVELARELDLLSLARTMGFLPARIDHVGRDAQP